MCWDLGPTAWHQALLAASAWGGAAPPLPQAGVGPWCRVPGARVGAVPTPRLTVLRLVQDVQDVRQLQRQLVRLLGHVRVHALDLGAV